MNWQPIETAPKDGAAILIYTPSFYFGAGVYLAWWGGDWWEVCTEGRTGHSYSCSRATHWMPLPEPPTTDKED